MRKTFLGLIIGERGISKITNIKIAVAVPLLFPLLAITVKYISHRELDAEILIYLAGFSLLHAVGYKSRELGVYTDKLEEALTPGAETEGNRVALLYVPNWKPYKLDAFTNRWGYTASVIWLASLFLMKPLGIHQLPVWGFFSFGLLIGFSLLLSFRKYLTAMRMLYREVHDCTASNFANVNRGYLIRYWLVFFSVFGVSTIFFEAYTRLMAQVFDIFRVLSLSSFLGVVAALTMGLIYAYRAFRLLLAELDAMRNQDLAVHS